LPYARVTIQGCLDLAQLARIVRGQVLSLKEKEYIEAATCLALPTSRILFKHLLPNVLPPLIVIATVQVAHAIALEATLSFLGLGMPITSPSLGLLIANGYQYLLFDFPLKNIFALGYKTSGIHYIERFTIPVCNTILSVARNAAHIIYYRFTLFKQTIEESAFPNIGPSDYR
jgi:hypothetical protein